MDSARGKLRELDVMDEAVLPYCTYAFDIETSIGASNIKRMMRDLSNVAGIVKGKVFRRSDYC